MFYFKKQTLIPMAVSGHNSNNETLVGMSNSLALSFYDKNNREIQISQISPPLDILIQRDPNLSEFSYEYVNATQIQISAQSYLLPNAFNLTATNASVHIELKPFSGSIGYLIVMKLGYTPVVNSTYADYTSFKIFCPSKLFLQMLWSAVLQDLSCYYHYFLLRRN